VVKLAIQLDVMQQRFGLFDPAMKWMRSMVDTAKGGRAVLPDGAWGSISVTSSVNGTARLISSSNSRLRILLVTKTNPLVEKLFCFIGR
jgi:hypothetical protein